MPKREGDIFMQSRILTVGRLVPRKGQSYLIEAVRRLVAEGYDIKLIIIGNGPEKERLLTLGKGLDLEIHSDLPEDEVNKAYQKADIFVLPSITDDQGEKEGLGMVLFEAINYHLPVVAFANGGIKEVIVDDETGILLPEKDVDGLVEAIKKLLSDSQYRTELIERAYIKIKERFSTETFIKQQVQVYDSILKREI